MVYLSYTPKFLQTIFPDLIWRIETPAKELYLSFDDGPIPEVTPWILEQLYAYEAKASFFCVGENAEKYPELLERIREENHTIGSHSYNHLSGWQTDNLAYILNVRKGARACGSRLYRPPYGKIKPSQTRILKHHYKIIMWDVLSGDFDPDLSAEACYQNVVRNSLPGSIVVFHDSIKSKSKLKSVLPRVLDHFSNLGYRFKALEESSISNKSYSEKTTYSESVL
ncbi:MAG: polysaccharide deacetylase family protein [Saprospiraceae bacterium]|nr:polysaccharide deacetylase family protein [Saprospiraceae bacterium]